MKKKEIKERLRPSRNAVILANINHSNVSDKLEAEMRTLYSGKSVKVLKGDFEGQNGVVLSVRFDRYYKTHLTIKIDKTLYQCFFEEVEFLP